MCAQWPLPLVHAGALSSQSAHRSTLLALSRVDCVVKGRVYTGRLFCFAPTAPFARTALNAFTAPPLRFFCAPPPSAPARPRSLTLKNLSTSSPSPSSANATPSSAIAAPPSAVAFVAVAFVAVAFFFIFVAIFFASSGQIHSSPNDVVLTVQFVFASTRTSSTSLTSAGGGPGAHT